MNRPLMYMCVVLVTACGAAGVLAVDFTVEIESDGPTTVAPGAKVYFAVTGQVDATGNYGLAAFVVDIQTNTGVPQGVGQQQVFGSAEGGMPTLRARDGHTFRQELSEWRGGQHLRSLRGHGL